MTYCILVSGCLHICVSVWQVFEDVSSARQPSCTWIVLQQHVHQGCMSSAVLHSNTTAEWEPSLQAHAYNAQAMLCISLEP